MTLTVTFSSTGCDFSNPFPTLLRITLCVCAGYCFSLLAVSLVGIFSPPPPPPSFLCSLLRSQFGHCARVGTFREQFFLFLFPTFLLSQTDQTKGDIVGAEEAVRTRNSTGSATAIVCERRPALMIRPTGTHWDALANCSKQYTYIVWMNFLFVCCYRLPVLYALIDSWTKRLITCQLPSLNVWRNNGNWRQWRESSTLLALARYCMTFSGRPFLCVCV